MSPKRQSPDGKSPEEGPENGPSRERMAGTGLSDSTGAGREAARQREQDLMGQNSVPSPSPGGSSGGPSARGRRASGLSLSVEIGGEVISVRKFGPDEVTVGRRPRNDITIDGAGLKVVSGYHMRLGVRDGEWWVEDRKSTNGTFLNGVRVDAPRPVRSGDVIELGRPEKTSGHQTVRIGIVIGDAGDLGVPAPVVEPAGGDYTLPAPKSMPATRPTPMRALLEEIQEKSCRLGELRFRLEAYVEDLASAVVERHGSLGVAETPGGAAVIELIARKERLDVGLNELESELPGMRLRLGDVLEPLESRAAEAQRARAQSEAALEAAKAHSKNKDARFLDSLAAATSGLMGGLNSLQGALAAGEQSPLLDLDRPSPPGGPSPLGQWAQALKAGVHDVERSHSELEAQRTAALEGRRTLRAAQAEFDAADAAWSAVRAEADARRDSVELMVSQRERSLLTSNEEIAAIREALGAASEEFILGVLAHPEFLSASLARLAGMDEARELHGKVDALQKELETLEERAS